MDLFAIGHLSLGVCDHWFDFTKSRGIVSISYYGPQFYIGSKFTIMSDYPGQASYG